ncbi:BAR domain-containing family protein [Multifurca ochricompacta]|uniref:BAR domain-containing family protein n=1 Tax=Multifurca ochricompacta TaxID=376703 RepID=A0AAD4QN60_9AGAM|nr:BAR domain-containing family protein [Multifurca ochricompacta]
MEGWSKLQSSLANLNLGQSANRLAKGFNSSVQATRERLGQVAPDEITELPQGMHAHSLLPKYKDLEAQVEALRIAHQTILRVTKAFESETYDYPSQIQESVAELGANITRGVTNFAANNLKGTNLPAPSPAAAPVAQHKTLPHALGRAASTAASTLVGAPGGNDDRLGQALAEYAGAWEKIAHARVQHDETIAHGFLAPWQQTLQTSINVAVKARQAVRVSRLELDSAKQTLKNASPSKQEHARLEVENGEDDLVQKTEVAITLMKAVLDNPESIKNLNELVKAQLQFYSYAAEALSAVQGEIEELSVAAEGDYRKSRDH